VSDLDKPFHVVVVDDEPVVRQAISQSLRSIDCTVWAYPSGELCLEALRDQLADLVISDISMPGMDGVQLLECIRALFPGTRVIMMSGYADIPTAITCVRSGALDFIEKPFDEDSLLPKVLTARADWERSAKLELSPAELRILQLGAAGRCNKEMAFEMAKSVRTIENIRQRLTKKFEASNFAEAIVKATQRGLV
jgi:FixJ family two-component response regulator